MGQQGLFYGKPIFHQFDGLVLTDKEILARLNLTDDDPLRMRIDPFSYGVSGPGVLSYGLGSMGYDLRLGCKFACYNAQSYVILDPLTVRDEMAKDRTLLLEITRAQDEKLTIGAGGFCLAESIEYLRIPEDCIALVLTKSTYARLGVCLNMTPLEPGWQGRPTIEITNFNALPVAVHPGQGVGQVVFLKASGIPSMTYAQRSGRYQGDTGLEVPKP